MLKLKKPTTGIQLFPSPAQCQWWTQRAPALSSSSTHLANCQASGIFHPAFIIITGGYMFSTDMVTYSVCQMWHRMPKIFAYRGPNTFCGAKMDKNYLCQLWTCAPILYLLQLQINKKLSVFVPAPCPFPSLSLPSLAKINGVSVMSHIDYTYTRHYTIV